MSYAFQGYVQIQGKWYLLHFASLERIYWWQYSIMAKSMGFRIGQIGHQINSFSITCDTEQIV